MNKQNRTFFHLTQSPLSHPPTFVNLLQRCVRQKWRHWWANFPRHDEYKYELLKRTKIQSLPNPHKILSIGCKKKIASKNLEDPKWAKITFWHSRHEFRLSTKINPFWEFLDFIKLLIFCKYLCEYFWKADTECAILMRYKKFP